MMIVVTGTVAPSDSQGDLKLLDAEKRLVQYKDALRHLIESEPEAEIVFAENSGFGTEAFEDIVALSGKHGIKLEVLSFKGDAAAVERHGKGYGEGEILKFVLDNSRIAAGEDYLVKITGRLVVDNIARIVRDIHHDRVYFNIPNIHRKEFYDTRLYGMPVDVFKRFFIREFEKVNDSEGYYLEHAYTDAAISNGLKVFNFPLYPRIVGQSGTSGAVYGYKEWKSRIRDFLSAFNVYAKTTRGDKR